MYSIRAYKHSDFMTLRQWYVDSGVCPPEEGMLVEDGTFILEVEGIPALSQTVYLTQSKELCYLEGIIKNPAFKQVSLEALIPPLWDTIFSFAKDRGYKNILGYCVVDKLKDKYVRLGLTRSMDNLSAFTRSL